MASGATARIATTVSTTPNPGNSVGVVVGASVGVVDGDAVDSLDTVTFIR